MLYYGPHHHNQFWQFQVVCRSFLETALKKCFCAHTYEEIILEKNVTEI